MNKLGARRLLKLAGILDKADKVYRRSKNPGYEQKRLEHPCGSPACAWGHYVFGVGRNKRRDFVEYDKDLKRVSIRGIDQADDEFDIDYRERDELFSTIGCNRAVTAADAAAYIRGFVARKQKGA